MKTNNLNLITNAFYSSLTTIASSQSMIGELSTPRLLKIRNADHIFEVSVRHRNQLKLRKLLADDFFIISPLMLVRVMRLALREHDLDLFALTVKHKEFFKMDPSFGRNFAFRFAVSYNLVSLVEILLEHPLVDPFDVKSQVLKFATKQGDQLIMELLRSRINTLSGSNITFLEACRNGQEVVVECLLSEYLVDPAYKSNLGIILAARNGHAGIIKMLLERADVDPGAGRNKALKLACFHGYGDIVKLLLKDDRVNHCSALILACKNGHTNVVQIIVENRRYQSQRDLNQGISIAISGGHLEIVEYLLDNTPINFNIGKINPIVIASIYGNLSILKSLLRDRRYQVGGTRGKKHLQFELNRGLYEASKNNHVELVDFFLTKTTAMPFTVTDSSGLGLEAALIACRFGHEEVLKRLMKDHRVVMTELWIFKAAINGHIHIVKLLLKNAKNDYVPRLLKAAMEGAQKRDQKNVIKYLLDL